VVDDLSTVPAVDRVALVGMIRDQNALKTYDIAAATELATTKIVGYSAVVSALHSRLTLAYDGDAGGAGPRRSRPSD
jgi:hypothetical protein